MPALALAPAAQAFDAVAERFDERFGAWLSVAAQRRAVRAVLLETFAPGSRLLEIGGGTGDDAAWLSGRGRSVLLTDPSPAMVRIAGEKLQSLGAPPPVVVGAEKLASLADERERNAAAPLDGAFSNFAGLNCVINLSPVGAGLARLVRRGGRLALVVFGTCPPGEWIVELIRRRPGNAFRRMSRGDVPARLGGQNFFVRYHREHEIAAAFAPHFRLTGKRGIGVCVPPSAAEPWISGYPRFVSALERIDRLVSKPLAPLGDHVLYEFERTAL
jgi:SAM-dependent methyltransferase